MRALESLSRYVAVKVYRDLLRILYVIYSLLFSITQLEMVLVMKQNETPGKVRETLKRYTEEAFVLEGIGNVTPRFRWSKFNAMKITLTRKKVCLYRLYSSHLITMVPITINK